MGFPDGSAGKKLSAMQEMCVQSLGQEDPLEEGMAAHARILAWRIPQTEEPGGLQSIGSQSDRPKATKHTHTAFFMVQLSHLYLTTGKN